MLVAGPVGAGLDTALQVPVPASGVAYLRVALTLDDEAPAERGELGQARAAPGGTRRSAGVAGRRSRPRSRVPCRRPAARPPRSAAAALALGALGLTLRTWARERRRGGVSGVDAVTGTSAIRRRWAALSVAAAGALLAVAALVPTATSSAWQDQVYSEADVLVVPGPGPRPRSTRATGSPARSSPATCGAGATAATGQLGVGSNRRSTVPVSAAAASAWPPGRDVSAGHALRAAASPPAAPTAGGTAAGGSATSTSTQPYLSDPSNVPVAVYDLPAVLRTATSTSRRSTTRPSCRSRPASTSRARVTAAGTAGCWGTNVGLTRPPSDTVPQRWPNAPIPLPSTAAGAAQPAIRERRSPRWRRTSSNACFLAARRRVLLGPERGGPARGRHRWAAQNPCPSGSCKAPCLRGTGRRDHHRDVPLVRDRRRAGRTAGDCARAGDSASTTARRAR